MLANHLNSQSLGELENRESFLLMAQKFVKFLVKLAVCGLPFKKNEKSFLQPLLQTTCNVFTC